MHEAIRIAILSECPVIWNVNGTSEWQQQSKEDTKNILKLYYFYAKYIFIQKHVCNFIGFSDSHFNVPLEFRLGCSRFSCCNDTNLISIYWAKEAKAGAKKNEDVKQKSTHRTVHILYLRRFFFFFTYATLVLLPFIHFTFIIRTKHIRFIWRMHSDRWTQAYNVPGRKVVRPMKTIWTTNGNMIAITLSIFHKWKAKKMRAKSKRNETDRDECRKKAPTTTTTAASKLLT